MTPVDLTKAPPRSLYAELGGLLMLGRTIDKLRASLPGGHLGAYKMAGFSMRLLEGLGIAEDDLQGVVAPAADDYEVAAWVNRHSAPARYPAVNAKLEAITVGDRLDQPDFFERYPIAKGPAPA